MRLKIGARTFHPVYGFGTITDGWYSKRGSENYAVKFDKGGPAGFAQNATNDANDLTEIA